LAYLLYEVVDTTAAWVRDADELTQPGETALRDHPDGNHVYISFEAAEAIGRVIQPILISPKVTDRLKLELLGVVLTSLRDLERRADLQPLATVLRESLIKPYGLSAQKSYLHTLKDYIDGQDHVLLAELRRLRTELSAAIDAAS